MRSLACALVCGFATVASAAPTGAEPDYAVSGISDWTTPPPPTAEPAYRPAAPKRLRLRNGLTVLVVENRVLPIFAVTLVVSGAGAAFDPPERFGLASLTADLLDEGAGGLSALALAEEEERLGADLELYADYDVGGLSARGLSKNLDGTLELVAKLLAEPALAPGELERVRGDRKIALQQRRDRPREVAGLMLSAALYGGDRPYGHAIAGTETHLAAITQADVQRFYQERWQPARATLVLAGDLDAATLVARLEPTLGRWKARAPAAPARLAAKPARPPAPSLRLAERPGAEQTEVRVGLIGPARTDPRFYAFEVLRTALGGGFTSRLTQRLREELGITYGASAVMDWRLQPGPFFVGTAIESAQTASGVVEVFAILRDLASRELTPEELDKTKHNLIRALPAEFESNLATTTAIASLVQLGLPVTWHSTYAANVRKVTARQVRAAAASLLPIGKLAVAAVGDGAALAALARALAPLGYGAPPILHDAAGAPR